MNKVYTRINWENYPSTKTELDAENLNTIDYAVNEMDNRIIEQDTSKANKTELSNLIKDWNMDESTGIITITKYNGSTIMFDLNIEKIPVSFSLSDDGILTMETDDGTKFTANIEAMIPILTFNESDDIAVSVEGTGINKTYTFSLKNGAVTEEKLHPNYLANIKVEVANANAYSQTASNAATTSQSWAVGGTDSRENEDSNNAKYWAEQARTASGVGIASTSTAGKVLATNDVKVDSTGAMSIGTEFTVPEGLTNLVSGSDWNVILGQLAKLVGDYIDEKLTGYSTAGDVIANSGSSPISMAGLKDTTDTLNSNLNTHIHDGRYYTETEIDTKLSTINTNLNKKAPTITGGISTYAYSNFTPDRAIYSGSNGKLTVSGITAVELGHLAGVTGNIQAQINAANARAVKNMQSNNNHYLSFEWAASGLNFYVDNTLVATLKGFRVFNGDGNIG